MDAERQTLLQFLDAQRRRVFVVVQGLADPDLRRAVLPSGWTCLELVHHLAAEERLWFRGFVGGEPVDLPKSAADDAAEWLVDMREPVAAVLDLYRDEISRANAVIAAVPLDAKLRRRSQRSPGWQQDVRWVILHMIEETARHLGHLDVARELLDGQTGLGQDRTGG